MANVDIEFVDSWNREMGENDGAMTFEEACVHVNGQKLNGPLRKPLKSDRPLGDISLGDLPVRNLTINGNKLEQFADIILNVPLDASASFWDNTVYTIFVRRANTEIYQKHYDSLPNPTCHTACRSLCFLPRILQMISSLTSTSSSTSTCIGTSSLAKSVWTYVKDVLCDSIGALMQGLVLWL